LLISLVFSGIFRILVLYMIDMIDKLKILGLVGLIIVVLLSVQPAIMFLSKGFLLLLHNPLEGLAFFFLLLVGITGMILLEEREKKQK